LFGTFVLSGHPSSSRGPAILSDPNAGLGMFLLLLLSLLHPWTLQANGFCSGSQGLESYNLNREK